MLNGKSFEKIDESTISSLIVGSATEDIQLEFNRKFEESADGINKLHKTISTFANTQRGYLIVGLHKIIFDFV